MELSKDVREALAPLVASTHRVLRALDAKEVPQPLRSIAGRSARRLPPPLASKVLEELDASEWLRLKVAEEADDLDEIGSAFLARADGWEQVVDAAAGEAAALSSGAAVERLMGELEASREAVAAAKRRQRRAEHRAEQAEAALREERSTRKHEVDEARASARNELFAHLREVEQRLRDAEAALTQIPELERRVSRLREQLSKKEQQQESKPTGPHPWTGDTLEVARLLDEISGAAAAGNRSHAPLQEPEPVVAFELPTGLRPDGPRAVAEVLDHPHPLVIAIDGYNVAGEGGADLADLPAARSFVAGLVRRMARRSSQRHRILTVYDAEGVDQRKGDLVFTPDADEELRAMAAAHPGLVVISNDREVIETTTARGATAIWTTALLRWAED